MMDKDVFAALALNEAVSLLVIEPLDRPGNQFTWHINLVTYRTNLSWLYLNPALRKG
jgi:hypothetical protein